MERTREQQFECTEGDWQPTAHGRLLGDVLQRQRLVRGKDVLELGAGVGNHTVLLVRGGARHVVATEITEERLETTRRNVERLCGKDAPVEYRVADWLRTTGKFDLVVTNPPFAKSGKRNRRYFLDKLILDSFRRLKPEGELLFVQSSMADLNLSMQMMLRNGYEPRILAQREEPWREYYFEDPRFLLEAEEVEGGYDERDGQRFEILSVLHGRLRSWSPPAFAH
jgi:predicted RNA methylase